MADSTLITDSINSIETETGIAEATVKPHLVLALDYGVKKMGMALGNTITETARAFDILAMNNGQPDWDNLLGIVKVWGSQKWSSVYHLIWMVAAQCCLSARTNSPVV